MPYRHAHYWLLALFPLIVISFWPGYFGHIIERATGAACAWHDGDPVARAADGAELGRA